MVGATNVCMCVYVMCCRVEVRGTALPSTTVILVRVDGIDKHTGNTVVRSLPHCSLCVCGPLLLVPVFSLVCFAYVLVPVLLLWLYGD